jgi:hypothetical protein
VGAWRDITWRLGVLKMKIAPLFCMIILHVPGGGEVRIYADHISAVRAVPQPTEQLHRDVKALVYIDGHKPIGVVEPAPEVQRLIEECD